MLRSVLFAMPDQVHRQNTEEAFEVVDIFSTSSDELSYSAKLVDSV